MAAAPWLNQLARFGPVLDLVEAAPGDRLLDVGSGSEGIARYAAPRWRITACDLDFSDYGVTAPDAAARRAERVRGSVLDLPFPDRAFDVVVALDLLEHVPPPDRARALSELARVGRGRVVVACPAGAPALRSDRRLAGFYRRLGLPVAPWLAEHLDHGFPERSEIATGLAPHGALRLFGNEWLPAHGALMRWEATPYLNLLALAGARALGAGVGPGRGPAARLARAALGVLRGGDRAPSYRVIACLDRGAPSGPAGERQ